MTQMLKTAIHPGMRVFAGSDEIGKVTAVREDDFEVSRGLIFRHTYAIPAGYVQEAVEDIVDLKVDKDTVDGLEVVSATKGSLPDEYRRLELRDDDSSRPDDPLDPPPPR